MKKLLNCLLAIVACITLTSCYDNYLVSSTEDWKNAHIGATHHQLVQTYGAPDRQQSDGNGGTILIYEETQTQSQSIATKENINYFTGTYTPGIRTQTNSYTYYNHFFIDDKGFCYQVNTNIDYNRYMSQINPGKTVGAVLGTVISTAAIIASAYALAGLAGE